MDERIETSLPAHFRAFGSGAVDILSKMLFFFIKPPISIAPFGTEIDKIS